MLNLSSVSHVVLATASEDSMSETPQARISNPHREQYVSTNDYSNFGETNSTEPQGLVSRLMSDIDPVLLAFLQNNINSFIKWDLIHFFHNNPHTMDTAQNIARYTGRDIEKVAKELEEMAEQKILNRQQLQEMRVYSLSNKPSTREIIEKFINSCQDRQFRVKAIYHLIRSMH
jgi:hypothetical protein